MVNLDTTYSLRQISVEIGSRKSGIRNTLRKYKYYPYKAQYYQEIFAVGEESRSAFCYEMQERTNNNYHRFLSAICFSFTLNNEPMLKTRDIELRKTPELICILARIQYP
jgi:hypothetical protein